jgi:hypothetical protein
MGNGKKCSVCKKSGHTENDCWYKMKKCSNCSKAGHVKEDCWSPGGGKAGKGPFQKRGSSSRCGKVSAHVVEDADTTQTDEDVAFKAQEELEYVSNDEPDDRLCWYDWLVDSGTMSHHENSLSIE